MIDDLRRLRLGPHGVRLVGVSGGEQPGRRVVRPVRLPVCEAGEVEVDVRLLPLVTRTGCTVSYRDGYGDGVFYMWTEDGSRFKHPRDKYFGFDVDSEPTALPMPGGDHGIMIAGILPAAWNVTDAFNFPDAGAIIWTILMPEEPPKTRARGKADKRRPAAAAKKAARKPASKVADAKKPAAKKAVKPKGKATAARKALSAS